MKNVKRFFAAGTVLVLFLSLSFYATSKPSGESSVLAGRHRVWLKCITPDGQPGVYGTCQIPTGSCSTLTECIPTSNQ